MKSKNSKPSTKDFKLKELRDKFKKLDAEYRKTKATTKVAIRVLKAASLAEEKAADAAENAQIDLELHIKDSVRHLLPKIGKLYDIMYFQDKKTDTRPKGWYMFDHMDRKVKIKQITSSIIVVQIHPSEVHVDRFKETGELIDPPLRKPICTANHRIADLGKRYKFVAVKA